MSNITAKNFNEDSFENLGNPTFQPSDYKKLSKKEQNQLISFKAKKIQSYWKKKVNWGFKPFKAITKMKNPKSKKDVFHEIFDLGQKNIPNC